MTSRVLKKANAIIGDYVVDPYYVEDDDPNKVILLWTSKFHKHLNNILRTYTFQKSFHDTIWTRKYLKELLSYFKANVKTKDWLIEKNIKILYRGSKKFNFIVDNKYIDEGFIATTTEITTADDFAEKHGRIFCFDVKDLPNNCPFVYIDDAIADHLYEDEVLFLPGKITVNKNKDNEKHLNAIYEPKPEIIELMKNPFEGGHYKAYDTEYVPIPKSALTNMNGKLIIWHRCIIDEQVQCLRWFQIGKENGHTIFRKDVMHLDDDFYSMNSYIPHYTNLIKKKDRTEQEEHLLHSYTVHMAIIDPIEKRILDFRYGIPHNMAKELYDTTRDKEIEEVILKECVWMMK